MLTIFTLTWIEIIRRRTPLVIIAVALLLTVGAFIPPDNDAELPMQRGG